MARVMIADDEVLISMALKIMLEQLGHSITGTAASGEEAAHRVLEQKPDLVFLDVSMKHKDDGIAACREIKSGLPSVKVVFLSAYPEKTLSEKLGSIAYDGYLEKPASEAAVIRCLRSLGIQNSFPSDAAD